MSKEIKHNNYVKNLAIIVPALDKTGPAFFVKYLVSGLIGKIENIDVFYFKKCEPIQISTNIKRINFFNNIKFNDYDIIMTTMAVPDLYAALRLNKNKWVSSLHNCLQVDLGMLYSTVKANIISYIWKCALNKCKNIAVTSKYMKDYYVRLIGNKNYFIIPEGVEEKQYNSVNYNDLKIIEEYKSRNLIIVGSVGVLIKRKGFIQLIDVLESHNNLALIIIGDGPEKEAMMNLIMDRGLSNRVSLLGFRNNAYNYYQYFDIYAHVSLAEGFGLALIEAMSKGLPIICSKLATYDGLISDKDVCYFYPGNTVSLNSAFDNILANLKYYGERSYLMYKQNFNANLIAQKYLDCFNSVLRT